IFIRDARTLQAVNAESTQAVILMSAFLGKARLIDNQVVELVKYSKEEVDSTESESENSH
ncbi:pantoate--beta-alanine ligase, partial [Vibrio vulnificus]